MGPVAAGAVLVVTTILVAICAEYLVGSIDDLVESAGISKAFIGLILIPIVGNAAEHVTAVVVAVRDKMDLAMGVAIGSSIQIALLVTPFLVIVGWIIGREMTLHFEICKLMNMPLIGAKLTYSSPNCCFCSFSSGRYVHRSGWQVQLSRGCYASWIVRDHCPGFLCYSQRCHGRDPCLNLRRHQGHFCHYHFYNQTVLGTKDHLTTFKSQTKSCTSTWSGLIK